MRKIAVALLILAGTIGPAVADEVAPKPLPSLALDPPEAPSIWHGLYVGTDVFGVSRRGSKGFVGGDVTAGYDRAFANNLVLGVEATTGVAPDLFGYGSLRGYDFAAASAKLGYDMGRWMPYLTTTIVLAKPTSGLGGSFNGMDQANALLGSPEKLEAAGRVGAGVNYALTNNLSVDLGMSVGRGAVAVFP